MQEKDSSSQNVNFTFPLIISSLSPVGKGGKFHVSFSNNSTLIFFKEIIAEENLFEGREINENDFLRLCRKQNFETTIRRGLNLLARRAHSEQEIRQKLLLRGCSEDSIKNAVNYYYHYNYIDDEDFAGHWVAARIKKSGYGRSRIIQELYKKGISREIINKVTSKIYTLELELEECLKYFEKIKQRPSFSEPKSAQKLSSRGFSWAVIKKVLKEYSQ